MNIWGVSAGGNQQALPHAANSGAMLDPPRSGRLYHLSPAGWQSGYAEDCKSSYSGSIPLPASRGLRPPQSALCSPVAQLVERAAVNRLVAGSSPARGANSIRGLGDICLTPCLFRYRTGTTLSPRLQ